MLAMRESSGLAAKIKLYREAAAAALAYASNGSGVIAYAGGV